jgi:hypothetical protein
LFLWRKRPREIDEEVLQDVLAAVAVVLNFGVLGHGNEEMSSE